MIRRSFAVSATVALALSTAVGCSSKSSGGRGSSGGDKEVGTVKVGVIAPLTGGSANYGTGIWQGAQLAVEQVNQAGGITVGGKKYKLEAESCDDQFVASQGVQCGRLLSSRDHATMIFSASSLEAFPMMSFNQKEPNPFILMAIANGPTFTTQGNKLVVRMVNDLSQTVPGWVGELHKYFATNSLSIKTAALLKINTEFGSSWSSAFEGGWKSQGGTITQVAGYDANATDYTNQLLSILKDKPDAIVLTTSCQPSALVVKQARQMGYKGIFLSASSCSGGAQLTANVSGDLVGTFLSEAIPSAFATSPGVAEFQQAYKAKFGKLPDGPPASASNQGLKWFALAMEKAGTTTDLAKIHAAFEPALAELGKDNLYGIQAYDPATGNVRMSTKVGITTAAGELKAYP